MSEYSKESLLLKVGMDVPGMSLKPEAAALFQTTAFNWGNLSEAKAAYAAKNRGENFTYVRTINPNREIFGKKMTYLENGEKTEVCAAGMGAIATTLETMLQAGDHAIYSNCCYGESLEIFQYILGKYGVESTAVNISDLEAVKAAVKPNTKMIYSEVIANPNMVIADVPALAEIAHNNGASLVIDNTFTTPLAIRPLDMGADVVINSVTKFLNGHSDVILGTITAKDVELVKKMHWYAACLGNTADPHSAWLATRGLHTAFLRIPRQMATAAKLAAALEADPHVVKVNHPSLESFPQHETAMKLFRDKESMTAMMSIVLPEDMEKMDKFMNALTFAHYAPTLGGMRTSYQQPCTSSHGDIPDEERRKVGITPGMIRISVGIEDADELIADFLQALKAFD